MPLITDEGAVALGAGAVALGAGAEAFGARATEALAKIVPSQTTTLVVGGGAILLGFGWLALMFYKESRSGATVHHIVTHTPSPSPPPAN